jgi:hypothetical protein
MVKLTELVTSDRLTQVPVEVPLIIHVHYVFTEDGKEVSRMFSFIAENKEQYEQFNRALLSAYPEVA